MAEYDIDKIIATDGTECKILDTEYQEFNEALETILDGTGGD
jgi:hypothetical protein